MFPAFLMGVLQLSRDPWLPPDVTPPGISPKLNNSIFIPQKILLLRTSFDWKLKNPKILECPTRTEIVIFFCLAQQSLWPLLTHSCENGREIAPNKSALVWSLLQSEFNCI